MTQTAAPTATARPTLLRVLQIFAGLAVLNVLFQFITAGQLFRDNAPTEAHGAGAIVLHVVSGIAAIAAVLLWRQGVIRLSLAVLAAAVFVYTFIQAAIGGYNSLGVHIPGAMLLTAGVVWLLIASLRLPEGRGARA